MAKIIKKAIKKVVEEESVVVPIVEERVQPLASNTCGNCNGTGKQNSEDLCVICQGRGIQL